MIKNKSIWINKERNNLLKKNQKELFDRFEIDKNDIDLVFNDYWEKLNNKEVKNILEYMKSKGIKHKPEFEKSTFTIELRYKPEKEENKNIFVDNLIKFKYKRELNNNTEFKILNKDMCADEKRKYDFNYNSTLKTLINDYGIDEIKAIEITKEFLTDPENTLIEIFDYMKEFYNQYNFKT